MSDDPDFSTDEPDKFSSQISESLAKSSSSGSVARSSRKSRKSQKRSIFDPVSIVDPVTPAGHDRCTMSGLVDAAEAWGGDESGYRSDNTSTSVRNSAQQSRLQRITAVASWSNLRSLSTRKAHQVKRCFSREGFHSGCHHVSTRIADSTKFAMLTTSLTVYALFGDDFRLAYMQMHTDVVFDVLTILCIVVFFIEIVATCIAKVDYIGGFWFWMDAFPTGTLLLDLTFVADALFCSNVDGGSALKSGKAGRAGARAGRTVRIIRLVRLVKVYKMCMALLEQREQDKISQEREQERKEMALQGTTSLASHYGAPGEDIQDDEQVVRSGSLSQVAAQLKTAKNQSETRVGKKLSEMTTRRVICLVLIMLFGLPLFLPGTHDYDELKSSPSLAIELLFHKWQKWCPFNATHPSEPPACFRPDFSGTNLAAGLPPNQPSTSPYRPEARLWFERYLLSFLYQHHEGNFAWKAYWIGLNSNKLAARLGSRTVANERLAKLGQLSQAELLGNYSLPPTAWDQTFAGEDWVSSIVKLAPEVKTRLTSLWTEECMGFIGVALRKGDVRGGASCTLNEELRCMEMEYYTPLSSSDAEADDIKLLFVFDRRGTMWTEASLGMLQTIFICLAVGIGAVVFNNDANTLLLMPIERMMGKLNVIKGNPMAAMRLGDQEFKRKECESTEFQDKVAGANKFKRCWYHFKSTQKTQDPMETVILEKTIVQLGGLLALCFGEEGGSIIGKYIGDADRGTDKGSAVDIMVAGHRVDAIIAVCQIRQVNYVALTLQEECLLFVNMVSEIVHMVADDYSGAPNKNIGDYFVLAWNYDVCHIDDKSSRMKLNDMAVLACVKIRAEVTKSRDLRSYCCLNHLTSEGGDVMSVDVGLGLHTGWVVEGAIGSPFKIDASYMSPNVKIADQLQEATVQYGTPIIMSDVVVASCSPELAAMCRIIDQVNVKSLKRPMRIHTIDLDTSKLVLPKGQHIIEKKTTKNRYKWRQWQDRQKAAKWKDEFKVWEQFYVDKDLIKIRSTFTDEFYRRFFTAYRNYEAGEWMVARDLFYTCHFEPKFHTPPVNADRDDWPPDGPTRALLEFMQGHAFESPPNWPGYRLLKETR